MTANSIPELLTIGIIQFKPDPGQVGRNLESTEKLLSSASERGAQIAVLPEMWPIGYGNFDVHKMKQTIPGPYTDFLSQIARHRRMHIVAGIPEEGPGQEIYNTSVLLSDKGEILAKHRKIHLYTALGEEKIWTPGNKFTVADTSIGRVWASRMLRWRFS